MSKGILVIIIMLLFLFALSVLWQIGAELYYERDKPFYALFIFLTTILGIFSLLGIAFGYARGSRLTREEKEDREKEHMPPSLLSTSSDLNEEENSTLRQGRLPLPRRLFTWQSIKVITPFIFALGILFFVFLKFDFLYAYTKQLSSLVLDFLLEKIETPSY